MCLQLRKPQNGHFIQLRGANFSRFSNFQYKTRHMRNDYHGIRNWTALIEFYIYKCQATNPKSCEGYEQHLIRITALRNV